MELNKGNITGAWVTFYRALESRRVRVWSSFCGLVKNVLLEVKKLE